jgi:hypothetical protein
MYHPHQYEVAAKLKIKELRKLSDPLQQENRKRRKRLPLLEFLLSWLASIIG